MILWFSTQVEHPIYWRSFLKIQNPLQTPLFSNLGELRVKDAGGLHFENIVMQVTFIMATTDLVQSTYFYKGGILNQGKGREVISLSVLSTY